MQDVQNLRKAIYEYVSGIMTRLHVQLTGLQLQAEGRSMRERERETTEAVQYRHQLPVRLPLRFVQRG